MCAFTRSSRRCRIGLPQNRRSHCLQCEICISFPSQSRELRFLLFNRAAGFLPPQPRFARPAGAGHVQAGRFFSGHRRLGLDMTEHDGRLVGLGRKAPPSVLVWPSGIANLCRLHRSLRGRAHSPQNGRPEASAPQCPERDHRSVAAPNSINEAYGKRFSLYRQGLRAWRRARHPLAAAWRAGLAVIEDVDEVTGAA